jgi:SAM-dependent methyltransferase
MVAARFGSAAYWSVHAVAGDIFITRDQSLNHFRWRSDQYIDYLDLMPLSGRDGMVMLDYGCGPGNDLVGFVEFSKPKHLIGVDVSPLSLKIAEKRLKLHDGVVEFKQISEKNTQLSIDSESVDVVHSSGVLHHVVDLPSTLSELYRVLKIGGELRVMVYNYDSIWLHLNTGYIERKKRRNFAYGVSDFDIFRSTTDGKECPIANCYKPHDFLKIVLDSGFSKGTFLGAALSMHELDILPQRFNAIADLRLDPEHRNFLLNLKFDDRGIPLNGNVNAGSRACYVFWK